MHNAIASEIESAPATGLGPHGPTEEGAALGTRSQGPATFKPIIVIGGGQAGLSVGYHLKRLGADFLILDGAERIGDAWRKRWDSLKLFSPARFDRLDGLPFPARPHSFPSKDEMADYLESYARAFELPVVCGARVERLSRDGTGFSIAVAGGARYRADRVIVAMSNYQVPQRPAFAGALDPRIRQFDPKTYRNPGQLADGTTLVVGAANSGAEIARDIARHQRVLLAGRKVAELPGRFDDVFNRFVLIPLIQFVIFRHVLTVDTPIGRRVRPKLLKAAAPLIRVKSRDLAALGVTRTGRVVGERDGLPVLEDGTSLEVDNVIWCTGFAPDFSWIDLDVLDEDGEPRHDHGVALGAPGLYFLGLHFLISMTSNVVHGVRRDARRIAAVATAEAARG